MGTVTFALAKLHKFMTTNGKIEMLLKEPNLKPALRQIAEKVFNHKRITPDEGVLLYEQGELGFVGALANYIRERKHGDNTYFNRNFHIEPTNICVYDCKFCSYSRMIKKREEGWEYTLDEMMDIVKKYDGEPVTEVHIVGGVLPQYDLQFYAEFFQKIKAHRPELHAGEADHVEQFVDAALAHARGQAEELGVVLQRLAGVEERVEVRLLGQIADPLLDRHVAGRTAEDRHAAGGLMQQAQQDLDRRALTAAVGAQQAEDLAAVHPHVDASERVHPLASKEQPAAVVAFVDVREVKGPVGCGWGGCHVARMVPDRPPGGPPRPSAHPGYWVLRRPDFAAGAARLRATMWNTCQCLGSPIVVMSSFSSSRSSSKT